MSFLVQLDRKAPADKIGGKARSLLKLAEAGLAVPPAIAVTTELYATLRAGGHRCPPPWPSPGRWRRWSLRRAPSIRCPGRRALPRRWPGRWPVSTAARSRGSPCAGRPPSKSTRRAGRWALVSRVDLPAAQVEQALREVLASALAPGVVAYFAQRKLPTDKAGFAADGMGFAALIHPYVAGDAAGSAALDWSHGAPIIDAHHGDAARARARIQDALARLTVKHGPVEVEWVATGYEVIFLQMRPYRRRERARLSSVSQIGLQLGWRWDAAHNPLPLSPAQAGLVALVDRLCDTGLRQQTLRGYLFYSHAPRPPGTTRRAAGR